MRLSLALAAALVPLCLISVAVGPFAIWRGLWAGDPLALIILAELRLPRALLAMLIGGSLALAGAAMQGYLRNPLADPGLFGISSAAALGAVTAIALGLSGAGVGPSGIGIAGFALIGGVGGMALLALLAGRTDSVMLFTLAGVMLASLTGALTALVISLAPTPFAAAEIITWLIGSLTDRSWQDVAILAPAAIVGGAALLLAGRALDALTLGVDAARSLGTDLRATQWLLLIGVGLISGASVAVAGVIGFVGLVVPHLVRPLVGNRPSALLLPSALAGAAALLAADTAVRLLPLAAELRLGVLTSLIGAPFFLALLFRLRRGVA